MLSLVEKLSDEEQIRLLNMKIELFENQKNYVKALNCLLQQKSQLNIFEWIQKHFDTLIDDEENQNQFKEFKDVV